MCYEYEWSVQQQQLTYYLDSIVVRFHLDWPCGKDCPVWRSLNTTTRWIHINFSLVLRRRVEKVGLDIFAVDGHSSSSGPLILNRLTEGRMNGQCWGSITDATSRDRPTFLPAGVLKNQILPS